MDQNQSLVVSPVVNEVSHRVSQELPPLPRRPPKRVTLIFTETRKGDLAWFNEATAYLDYTRIEIYPSIKIPPAAVPNFRFSLRGIYNKFGADDETPPAPRPPSAPRQQGIDRKMWNELELSSFTSMVLEVYMNERPPTAAEANPEPLCSPIRARSSVSSATSDFPDNHTVYTVNSNGTVTSRTSLSSTASLTTSRLRLYSRQSRPRTRYLSMLKRCALLAKQAEYLFVIGTRSDKYCPGTLGVYGYAHWVCEFFAHFPEKKSSRLFLFDIGKKKWLVWIDCNIWVEQVPPRFRDLPKGTRCVCLGGGGTTVGREAQQVQLATFASATRM